MKATWPGLGPGQLFENRDPAPTADLHAVAKGIPRGAFATKIPARWGRYSPAATALLRWQV